jgi:hypothetical protein
MQSTVYDTAALPAPAMVASGCKKEQRELYKIFLNCKRYFLTFV